MQEGHNSDQSKRFMPDPSLPVKYVLYSHYSPSDDSDFAAYRSGASVEQLDGIKRLPDYFRGLRELLTTPGHEGILLLFFAPGFEEFIRELGDCPRHDENGLLKYLLDKSEKLRFAQSCSDYIRRQLNAAGLASRVRFLTALDLQVILGRVNAVFAEMFQTYFVGPAKGIRYDTPKIPESILRLRVLGNGVPVLRVDHDVLFRNNERIGDLGMFKAVACSCLAYQLRLQEPS